MAAETAKLCTYKRRTPEDTVLYQVLALHLETFIAERKWEQDQALPDYVVKELRAFLRCGIVQYGFLRLKCSDCHHEKIVAFSCKKRGFCPACGGKRMCEAALHLLDNILPPLPYRQFVVSFPIPLRFWMATSKKLTLQVQKIVIATIENYQVQKARDTWSFRFGVWL